MHTQTYKRNYHPLVILLYTSGMLSLEELNKLPRTTKYNWNQFKHENYHGYELATDYIQQFDDIKDIYQSKYTARAVKTILRARKGYYNMLSEVTHHKKLLNLHANSIIDSVENMAKLTGITVRKACKFYGISKDWYYYHRNKIVCELSPLKKCFRQYPNQLALDEISTIKHAIADPKNNGLPLSTIYFQGLRDNIFGFGITAFRKYANAFGYVKPKRKKKKPKFGFKASYVFEWLHIDVTFVETVKDGVQKVAFVKDNYSSGLLHYKSTNGKADSSFITDLLQEAFFKHNLYNYNKDIHILSDGGSENKGKVLSWVKNIEAPPIIKKITALTDEFPHSNSMSESTHRTYKTDYMNGEISIDLVEHQKSLVHFFEYYNNIRLPCRLHGRTPMEVINGLPINKHLFSEQRNVFKIARLEKNKKLNNCIAKRGCNTRLNVS